MKLFFQHFFLSHLLSFVSYQAEFQIGPDFRIGFQTGFSDRISDQNFGPDIPVRIFWAGFRTRFKDRISDQIFRTGFSDQISDRISDQISDRILDRFSDWILDRIVLLSFGYCLVIIQLSKQCAPNFLFH